LLRRLTAIRQGHKLRMGPLATCNRRSMMGLSAAFLGAGVAFSVARGRRRSERQAAAIGRLRTLPSEFFLSGPGAPSFTSTDTVLINRSPEQGFALHDLRRGGPDRRRLLSGAGKDATISAHGTGWPSSSSRRHFPMISSSCG
jgi:hypothetical protein